MTSFFHATDDDEKDPDTKNLVLCQFDKACCSMHGCLCSAHLSAPYVQVSHTKNKWKALLRNGIMVLDGTEYVFNTATGTFTF